MRVFLDANRLTIIALAILSTMSIVSYSYVTHASIDWTALGTWAQAFGVVGTLIYIARQVEYARQQVNQVRDEARTDRTASYNDTYYLQGGTGSWLRLRPFLYSRDHSALATAIDTYAGYPEVAQFTSDVERVAVFLATAHIYIESGIIDAGEFYNRQDYSIIVFFRLVFNLREQFGRANVLSQGRYYNLYMLAIGAMSFYKKRPATRRLRPDATLLQDIDEALAKAKAAIESVQTSDGADSDWYR